MVSGFFGKKLDSFGLTKKLNAYIYSTLAIIAAIYCGTSLLIVYVGILQKGIIHCESYPDFAL